MEIQIHPLQLLLISNTLVTGCYILFTLLYSIPSLLKGNRSFGLVYNQIGTWASRHVICIITMVVLYLTFLSIFTEDLKRDYLNLSFNFLIMLYNSTYINNILMGLWTSSKSTNSYAMKAVFLFLLPILVCFGILAYALFNTNKLEVMGNDMLIVTSVTMLSFYVNIIAGILVNNFSIIDAKILKKSSNSGTSLLQLITLIYNFVWMLEGTPSYKDVSPPLLSMCIVAYMIYFHMSINSLIYTYNSPESVITQDERQVLMFLYNRSNGSGNEIYMDLENVSLLKGFLHKEYERVGIGRYVKGDVECRSHKNNIHIHTHKFEDDHQNECVKLDEEEVFQELEEEEHQDDVSSDNPDKESEKNTKVEPELELRTDLDMNLELDTEIYYPIKQSFFTSSAWKSLFRKLDKYRFLENTTYFEQDGRAMIMRERYNHRNMFTDIIYRGKWDMHRLTNHMHIHGNEPEQIEMMEF